ncbi:MAG: peptide chain release factor N(5)-glutamine methyltransferase [Gracilimonas sp.]|uniref:peptide chain release factor N(5)-glutamine methyltransferase n=1 Tax=Gracilimonas TaxID=649462 RepID=UPI001B2F20B7|nr:peptide chain release factor N(5)-glutamine methyltransferase [Gracilimonas sp.]MBO6584487.1 peptide chain release factor N(5)-glutamine methyltransferase [Gracilimonas sp.]MBO6616242.1 peptide chain release factor N(5)-glutamine methyltransferase [Gracilimonas sp.]
MPKAPSEWTVLSMLEWATEFFEERNVKSPRMSIEWLLAEVLSVKRLDLYLIYDRPLTAEELDVLRPLVKRRASHEPLQYITGHTDFYNVRIFVEPGVLIPRQETEELVAWILELYPKGETFSVLDVGTGSGCIPVALKKARPEWDLFATDISDKALSVAKNNAAQNEVDISFAQDDIFNPQAFSDRTFDLIISNPPYILHSEKSTLDKEVKDYEPEEALFCESTVQMYGALEQLSSGVLSADGTVFLELHEDNSGEVLDLFEQANWSAELKNDYGQKTRFLKAKKA